jgi:cyclic dehypoxanthinyl futalosine synthase
VRLSENAALFLYENVNLQQLGEAAGVLMKKRHSEPFRTYNIERNVNYTNICGGGCQF